MLWFMLLNCLQGDVLADGSDAIEVARWRARRNAEAEVSAAEAAASEGQTGAAERLVAAERQLEEVLEAGGSGDEWAPAVYMGSGLDHMTDCNQHAGNSLLGMAMWFAYCLSM